jgi:hypothetical protein
MNNWRTTLLTKAYLSNIIPLFANPNVVSLSLELKEEVKELGPLSSERPSVYDSLAMGEELW